MTEWLNNSNFQHLEIVITLSFKSYLIQSKYLHFHQFFFLRCLFLVHLSPWSYSFEMFQFFSSLMINIQHWTLLIYILTTGLLQSWQMAMCHLMPALILENTEMTGLLHVFLQIGLHQKLPHRVLYLLSPKLLDSGQPLTGLWNGKVRVLTILILNTTVEMEYRAIREKICVQGHDLLHISILSPRRDSGTFIIFIILEFLPEITITWEDFVPDSFIYFMCHGSWYSRNSRVKTLFSILS